MAIHRGIQSAIFFYLSCAPCAETRVRKRRRQQAERDRADRATLEHHMPGLYRHPEPSTTNPYWQAEIDAGPIPSRTRKKTADNKAVKASSSRSNFASTVSIDASLSMERSDSALSGIGPYQRRDEALWGSRASDISGHPRLGTASSSRDGLPTRLPRAALQDTSRSRSYAHPQNPAINDMHPPTTRKVQSKEEVMWMLQPPPPPEVMTGKTTIQPSRSDSGASRPSVSTKGRGASRPSSQRYPDSPTSPLHAASIRFEPNQDENRSAFLPVPIDLQSMRLTRSRTLPIRYNISDQAHTGTDVPVRKPPPSFQLSAGTLGDRKSHWRPPLSTVVSEGALPSGIVGPQNDRPHQNGSVTTTPLMSNSSKGTLASTQPGTTVASKQQSMRSPSLVETRLLVSAQDSTDDMDSEAAGTQETFESWTKPDFELPQWIHDHTRREVRERWSFEV